MLKIAIFVHLTRCFWLILTAAVASVKEFSIFKLEFYWLIANIITFSSCECLATRNQQGKAAHTNVAELKIVTNIVEWLLLAASNLMHLHSLRRNAEKTLKFLFRFFYDAIVKRDVMIQWFIGAYRLLLDCTFSLNQPRSFNISALKHLFLMFVS